MQQNMRANVLISLSLLLLFSTLVSAAQTGSEAVHIATNSLSESQGGSAVTGFNVTITSGYYSFSTTVSVENDYLLASNGITVILTNASGNPPFSGVMHIFTGQGIVPRTYNITLTGGGTNVNIASATLSLHVLPNSTTNTTSTVTTSTASTSVASSSISTASTSLPMTSLIPTVSVQPTTTQISNVSSPTPPVKSSSNLTPDIVAAIIIIVLILGLLFLRKGKKVSRKPPATAAQGVPKPPTP